MNDIIKNLESKENITNNDWRTVEQEIKYLYEMIKGIEVGATSFESITGLPEDNVALRAVLDGKASEVDLETLQGLVETLQIAISNVYTKTETDTLLDDKANVGDSYTKSEEDALLADKADQSDLDSLNDEVTQVESTLTDVQEELSDKVDKAEGYELMPEGLDEQVNTNKTDIEALQQAVANIPIIQVSVMPTPSVDYIGKIVQYVGPTAQDAINGYFYQCGYDEELLAYKWMEKKVMNAAEEGGVDAYTKAETNQLLDNKQDKLTAGEGIKITGNVIMQDIINDTMSSPQTTWSSRYLESLFHSLSGLSSIEIVDSRPAQPVNNTLYYVKAYEEGEDPLYEIWFYTNNTWTKFGTTSIDLTNYYTKTEVDTLLNNKQDTLTPGQGIDITNNNIAAKIDGTTLGINDAGNIYVKSGGGGGGGGFEPTSAQLSAMNSGITQAKREGYDTAVDDVSGLKTRMTTAEGDIDNLETALEDKADKSTTYTKTETDSLLEDKADADTTYTKTEVDTELGKKLDKRTGSGVAVYSRSSDTQGELAVKTSMSSTPLDTNLLTEKAINTELNKLKYSKNSSVIKLGNGLEIHIENVTVPASGTTTKNFATAFPNNCWLIVGSPAQPGYGASAVPHISVVSKSQYKVSQSGGVANMGINFIAIGN